MLAIYTSLSSHPVSPTTLIMSLANFPPEILFMIRDSCGHDNLKYHLSLMLVAKKLYDLYHPTIEEAFWAKVAKALGLAKPLKADDTTRGLVGMTMRSYDILRAFMLHLRRCEECAKRVGNPRSGITPSFFLVVELENNAFIMFS